MLKAIVAGCALLDDGQPSAGRAFIWKVVFDGF